MISKLILLAIIIAAIAIIAWLAFPGTRNAERHARHRAIRNSYIAGNRERARTHIITNDHHLIVGDGAWANTRARYPDLASDAEEPRGM